MTTTYTPTEAAAYEAGREARRKGLDYFDNPHMQARPRDLYAIVAFSDGWLDEDDPNRIKGDTDPDADSTEGNCAWE